MIKTLSLQVIKARTSVAQSMIAKDGCSPRYLTLAIRKLRYPTHTAENQNQSGVALLMVVFVIVFASLIVFELGKNAFIDQEIARSYSEGVQADFIAKSALNLARALLERTKEPELGVTDCLLEPWALIGSSPSLPIPGFFGEPRLMIVDEEGKIDINDIVVSQPQIPSGIDDKQKPQLPKSFWLDALHNLFSEAGFSAEQYPPESFRTPGNMAFAPDTQAATIHDWIDSDKDSYSASEFSGEGMETQMGKEFFFNRKLFSLSELLLVPGMTPERLGQIARFVKVRAASGGGGYTRINVNTAPVEVLKAIGLPESSANEFVEQRKMAPITDQDINNQISTFTTTPELVRYLKSNSMEFSVYVRVTMPNVTRWLHASLTRSGSTSTLSTAVARVELY